MFRELTLTFNGQARTVKPSMDLIRRLELAGLSPFLIAGRAARMDQCFAVYASFLGEVLRFAGFNVTDDQLYAELQHVDDMVGMITKVQTITASLLPPSPVPIDGAADAGKTKATTTKPRRSASGSRSRSAN